MLGMMIIKGTLMSSKKLVNLMWKLMMKKLPPLRLTRTYHLDVLVFFQDQVLPLCLFVFSFSGILHATYTSPKWVVLRFFYHL